jgi:hypothetical protein
MQQALFAGPEEEAAAASGKRKSKSADPGALGCTVIMCPFLHAAVHDACARRVAILAVYMFCILSAVSVPATTLGYKLVIRCFAT